MIGEPLPRLEDKRFVTGNGRYTDDINVDGQLYACFLRSPHAHAVISSIDTAAALAAEGVVAVLTGADYVAAGLKGIEHHANPAGAVDWERPTFTHSVSGTVFGQPHLPMAVDRVRHVGEAVAVVIANTRALARDASELIAVDYEVLDAVVRADDALREGAPQIWDGAPNNQCFHVEYGDRAAVKALFAQAAHVVHREFRNSRIVNCQMEPRSAIGCYDAAADRYTLIAGSQGVSRQKANMVAAFGVKPEQMRVVCPDTGGGFGPRTMLYAEQVVVTWAARVVGRPVKWTGERSEAFVSDYQGRDAVINASLAIDAEGHILALDVDWIGNVGAHPVSYVPMANGTRILSGVYHVPALACTVRGALSNTVPTAPYRGAGRPEATHTIERLLDLAARAAGLDRAEIRRRNVVRHETLPYLNPMGLTYDSGDFSGNMERALELADWSGFEARRAASRAKGLYRGIGVSNYIEAPVGAPRERIQMTVLADGVIDIISGTQSTGQGHETTFAQVVVAQLGVPIESIKLRTGDTDFVRVGGGTHSDRSMRLGGTLLVEASAKIIATGKAAAALMLECDPQTLTYEQGAYRGGQSGRRVSVSEVSSWISANGMPGDSSAHTWSATADFSGRMPAHPTGTAVCELEVDPETGDIHLLHHTSVDDVGRPINPLIIEGQVHGGLAQGIGQAMSEGYSVDVESGQVLSGSYMDYGVPRAGSVPRLTVELREDPTLGNPLGVKGGGESGITPATAVIFNALADALLEFGDEEFPMPATPAKIWSFIHRPTVEGDRLADVPVVATV